MYDRLNEMVNTAKVLRHVTKNKGKTAKQIALSLDMKPMLVIDALTFLENNGVLYTSRDNGANARYYLSGRRL
jgi:predicted ArsR family transcriptional regulator